MDFAEFVKPELLLLIPVLYALGAFIKGSSCADYKIPFILVATGIVLAVLYLFSSSDIVDAKSIATLLFTGITQGVLAAGAAVLVNQLFKQSAIGQADARMKEIVNKSKII